MEDQVLKQMVNIVHSPHLMGKIFEEYGKAYGFATTNMETIDSGIPGKLDLI